MLHQIMIIAHTFFATTGFIFGCIVLFPSMKWLSFFMYLGSMTLMTIFLMIVVGIDWSSLETSVQIAYSLLTALALYTLIRSYAALRKKKRQYKGWQLHYMDDVGFSLISLFDGFIIVSAIDLQAPIWIIILVGILGIVAGIKTVSYFKKRFS